MRSAFAALALAAALSAHAKTLEGFNASFGVVGALNNPLTWITEDMGHGYVFVGPSVDLFENRLSLHLDFGVSDRIFLLDKWDWLSASYETSRDTLFRISDIGSHRLKGTQGYWDYKGELRFGAWSVFAGELVQFRIYEDIHEGERETSFATSGNLSSYQGLSSEPYRYEGMWGSATVFPLYGVARRFGRLSLWVQGISLISVQAGASLSVKPVGPIGPHR